MSADDWQGCPVCQKMAYEYYEYAQDKLPFKAVKEIESKFKHIDKEDVDGWSPEFDVEYDGDDKKLDEIVEWANTSIETGNSVRIDYSYGINEDGTYSFDFGASCYNCGHEFTEERNNDK